ncbi:MAG: hypothetical protein KDK39_14765 [Leptospiraceae bacterium]|nr:hypothetical protein [Leptospiraceae bacterium]
MSDSDFFSVDEAKSIVGNILAAVDRGDTLESSEIVAMMAALEYLNGRFPELDIAYAHRITHFEKINTPDWKWQYRPWLIMQGAFPLDELPDHVRDILQKQFYQET